jgi:hypothetical protein
MAMGLPLSPIIRNIFVENLEKAALEQWLWSLKSAVCVWRQTAQQPAQQGVYLDKPSQHT